MIRRYVKKPIPIEAMQYDGTDSCLSKLIHWVGRKLKHLGDGKIGIETLEGVMEASIGDYIIKGVRGEFYPCKPDIFEETYQEVIE